MGIIVTRSFQRRIKKDDLTLNMMEELLCNPHFTETQVFDNGISNVAFEMDLEGHQKSRKMLAVLCLERLLAFIPCCLL